MAKCKAVTGSAVKRLKQHVCNSNADDGGDMTVVCMACATVYAV